MNAVPTVVCRVCETDVPAGEFCGLCGVPLTARRGDGPPWLRIRVYAAAAGEHLLRPALISSLFPTLPQPARTAFRYGLLALITVLVACTLLRTPAGLVAGAALGLPLLFMLALRESDTHRDLPVGTLLSTAGLGAALGTGWALLIGVYTASSYEIPLTAGLSTSRILQEGIAIPLGGLVMTVLPAVIMRCTGRTTREALEGFVIGTLGALVFTAAATVTRLMPQLTTGIVARRRPVGSMLIEAGIGGLAIPLIAAAAGGLVGMALWFTRPADTVDQRPGRLRLVVATSVVALLVFYLAVGVADVVTVAHTVQLALYLAVAAVALLALRVGVHLALLHEAHDEIQADQPVLCPHGGHVVPDMAFCPACGVATRASSRTARAARRQARPVPLGDPR
ncbi:zinc ribbon domain-containing protein [Mycolicibacterium thermoresistibile]